MREEATYPIPLRILIVVLYYSVLPMGYIYSLLCPLRLENLECECELCQESNQ